MSAGSLPERRPLDPVIEARVVGAQISVFEAQGAIEAVRAVLAAHNEEYLGLVAVVDLNNALRLALAMLGRVTDRLDLANLRDASRRAVVETTSMEEVDDAA